MGTGNKGDWSKVKRACERFTNAKFTSRKIDLIGFYHNRIQEYAEIGEEIVDHPKSKVLGIFEDISRRSFTVFYQLEDGSYEIMDVSSARANFPEPEETEA